MTEELALHPILDGWPTKHVLIRDAVHVSRIKDTRIRVDEIVRKYKSVPLINPVRRRVVSSFKVAAHAKEPCQASICCVMESSTIEGTVLSVSEEVLLGRVVGQGYCLG